jgi:nitrogen regulatory protein PII
MLLLITDREDIPDFEGDYRNAGLPLTLTALGSGTAKREVLDMFSLENTNKALFISLGESETVREAARKLSKHLMLDHPGTGILFIIPLRSVGGAFAARFQAGGHLIEKREQTMEESNAPFELIVAIANEGYSGFVMDAAREKGGATGGTILHARGVGNARAQKFFGISLSEEKELLLIVCRGICRRRIMQAIMEHAGHDSKARTILFSLPVSNAEGLWILREDRE